jgi:hypothetical protein
MQIRSTLKLTTSVGNILIEKSFFPRFQPDMKLMLNLCPSSRHERGFLFDKRDRWKSLRKVKLQYLYEMYILEGYQGRYFKENRKKWDILHF